MRRSSASLALLALLALAGCGGGGEGTTASTSTTSSTTVERSTGSAQRPSPAKKKSTKPEPEKERQATSEGDPVPGSRAVAPGVPGTRGGDNSIQTFGAEGAEGQRAQALADLKAYLHARLAGEWARACALASQEFRDELAGLIAQAKGTEKPRGCAQTLAALLGGTPPTTLREDVQVGELLSFRVQGKRAYLIFKGAKGAMFIALANDAGRWKVNVPQPTPFSETTQGSSR